MLSRPFKRKRSYSHLNAECLAPQPAPSEKEFLSQDPWHLLSDGERRRRRANFNRRVVDHARTFLLHGELYLPSACNLARSHFEAHYPYSEFQRSPNVEDSGKQKRERAKLKLCEQKRIDNYRRALMRKNEILGLEACTYDPGSVSPWKESNAKSWRRISVPQAVDDSMTASVTSKGNEHIASGIRARNTIRSEAEQCGRLPSRCLLLEVADSPEVETRDSVSSSAGRTSVWKRGLAPSPKARDRSLPTCESPDLQKEFELDVSHMITPSKPPRRLPVTCKNVVCKKNNSSTNLHVVNQFAHHITKPSTVGEKPLLKHRSPSKLSLLKSVVKIVEQLSNSSTALPAGPPSEDHADSSMMAISDLDTSNSDESDDSSNAMIKQARPSLRRAEQRLESHLAGLVPHDVPKHTKENPHVHQKQKLVSKNVSMLPYPLVAASTRTIESPYFAFQFKHKKKKNRHKPQRTLTALDGIFVDPVPRPFASRPPLRCSERSLYVPMDPALSPQSVVRPNTSHESEFRHVDTSGSNLVPDPLLDKAEVFLKLNTKGKWHCPVPACPKGGHPYARSESLRVHVKNFHQMKATTRTQDKPKLKHASRLERQINNQSPQIPVENVVLANDPGSASVQSPTVLPRAMMPSPVMLDRQTVQDDCVDTDEDEQLAEENNTSKMKSAFRGSQRPVDAADPTIQDSNRILRAIPEVPLDLRSDEKGEENIQHMNDVLEVTRGIPAEIPKPSQSIAHEQDKPAGSQVMKSRDPLREENIVIDDVIVPGHQESQLCPEITPNQHSMMSTQAALNEARLLFLESQASQPRRATSDNENQTPLPHPVGISAHRKRKVSFQKMDIEDDARRRVSLNEVPVNTQQLYADAAFISFSPTGMPSRRMASLKRASIRHPSTLHQLSSFPPSPADSDPLPRFPPSETKDLTMDGSMFDTPSMPQRQPDFDVPELIAWTPHDDSKLSAPTQYGTLPPVLLGTSSITPQVEIQTANAGPNSITTPQQVTPKFPWPKSIDPGKVAGMPWTPSLIQVTRKARRPLSHFGNSISSSIATARSALPGFPTGFSAPSPFTTSPFQPAQCTMHSSQPIYSDRGAMSSQFALGSPDGHAIEDGDVPESRQITEGLDAALSFLSTADVEVDIREERERRAEWGGRTSLAAALW